MFAWPAGIGMVSASVRGVERPRARALEPSTLVFRNCVRDALRLTAIAMRRRMIMAR